MLGTNLRKALTLCLNGACSTVSQPLLLSKRSGWKFLPRRQPVRRWSNVFRLFGGRKCLPSFLSDQPRLRKERWTSLLLWLLHVR